MNFIKEHWLGLFCMFVIAILVNIAPPAIQHVIGNFALGWMLCDIFINYKRSY